jgi:asparagine synthase (glutamine-hydrolysing)
MTMAHSVEGRVPFASPAVYAHAATLDFGELVSTDGTLKPVLRQAFADLLPPEVTARPKHGFNVPIDHWLKNDWADLVSETFSSTSALSRHNLLSRRAATIAHNMLNDQHQLNGHAIFCLIMLNLWLEQSA